MIGVEQGGLVISLPDTPASLDDGRGFRLARPRRPGALFGQVQHGADIEADAQQQDLGVGAQQLGQRRGFAQRVLQLVAGGQRLGAGADGRERTGGMQAAHGAGPGAEQLGHRAHATRGRDGGIVGRHVLVQRVEPGGRHRRRLPLRGIGQVGGVRRHRHQASVADAIQQGLDQRHRAARDPAQGAQRGVDQHRGAGPQAGLAQLRGQAVAGGGKRGAGQQIGFGHGNERGATRASRNGHKP